MLSLINNIDGGANYNVDFDIDVRLWLSLVFIFRLIFKSLITNLNL